MTTTPTAKPAACASQIPYINLFAFEDQYCSTLVEAEFNPLCLLDPEPKANFTFSGPPTKLNSPKLRMLGSGTQYPTIECIPLAVPNSYSVCFTIDGTSDAHRPVIPHMELP